jgi:hypothetical protein
MIENYIDSLIPSISDDEDEITVIPSIPTASVLDPFGPVYTLVVASKPSSCAFAHLYPAEVRSITTNGRPIGYAFTVNNDGFIVVENDMKVNLGIIFESFKRVIVLTSRQGPHDGLMFMSSTPRPVAEGTTSLKTAVTGIAARIFTECSSQGIECSVVVNEHRPIRVELDGIVGLAQVLGKIIGIPVDPRALAEISTNFRKVVPINSRVPLYT